MATVIENRNDPSLEQEIASRRFTVSEYYKMAEAGIIQPDERVELIEGSIFRMSPKGTGHSAATTLAARFFIENLGNRAVVRIQEPVLLDEHSEPEPDIVLAIPGEKNYAHHHPTPGEILLVMEISDTTLHYDRTVKARLYAQAGIPQYCLLNLNRREIEDYRDPGEEGYRSKQTYTADQSFSLEAFPDLNIPVSNLLPPQ